MNHHSTLKIKDISNNRIDKADKTDKIRGIYIISFKLRLFIGYSTDLRRERRRLLKSSGSVPYDLLCCGGTYRILEIVEDNTDEKTLKKLRDSYVEWFDESLENSRILY